MRVFRATYKDRNDKQREAAKWYVEFRDHFDRVRRLPAFTDKKQSEELGRKIEKLVACRANRESLDAAMGRWLESVPARIRNKLAEIGLLEGQTVAAGKLLVEHVDDFQAVLLAKGDVPKHARSVANKARRIIRGCGFQFWSDLSASKVQRFVADLREKGLSIQTSNFYLQAIKQFCKWMVRDGRASQSPMDHLQGQNVRTDRRHDRRALTVDETLRLLDATYHGPNRYRAIGPERWLVYRMGLEVGLRANEIRSLTRASFNLDIEPATVSVQAAYSKRKRVDLLPLRPELADALRVHLANKLPTAPAFTIPKSHKTAAMLRGDLADARTAWIAGARTAAERTDRELSSFLAYRDEAGLVADFHALRHTFITNLANSGVHPKVAQILARHSTITLTMDRYTHSMWEQLSDALAKLPDLGRPMDQRAQATGTDGKTDGHERVALCVARKGTESGNSVQSSAVNGAGCRDSEERENTEKTRGNTEEQSGWGGIRTPAGLAPRAVFKTAALDHSATHPIVLARLSGQLLPPGKLRVKPAARKSASCNGGTGLTLDLRFGKKRSPGVGRFVSRGRAS